MTVYRAFPTGEFILPSLDIHGWVDQRRSLCIHLRALRDERTWFLEFPSYLCYRRRDEGKALLTLDEMAKADVIRFPILIVEGSEFADWFVRENYGVWAPERFAHYLIATVDDIVDVLSTRAPTLREGPRVSPAEVAQRA